MTNLKKKKVITRPTINLEYNMTSLNVGMRINFKWYDKDLREFTEYGHILDVSSVMPVLKVLGDDKRTYIIAKEWVIDDDFEPDSIPTSEDLTRFSNDYL